MSGQLVLRFGLPPTASFALYLKGANRQLVEQLSDWDSFSQNPFRFIWGNSGVGKTHLLQAACSKVQALGQSSAYVPLKEIVTQDWQVLEGLADLDFVCIDDLQMLLPHRHWEEALFDLFNQRFDRQLPLVVSANVGPKALPFGLPDLQSRMEWGLVSALVELEDREKLQVLQARAEQRAMALPTEVSHYILHHYSRSLADLCDLLDRLDQASLIAKRKLTVPFVKEVLQGLGLSSPR